MDLIIKLLTPKDAIQCAAVHAESWRFAYSDIVSNQSIEKNIARFRMIWTKLLLSNTDSHYAIVYNNEIIGIITIAPSRDEDLPNYYEIVALYISPAYVGMGFGRQAMNWIKHEILSRGYNNILLWVLQDNYRARCFYEKSNFTTDYKTKQSGLGDTTEIRYIAHI